MKITGDTIIHGITIALAVADGILAQSANISAFSTIDPRLAQYWPQLMAGIVVFDRIAKIVLQQINTGPEKITPVTPQGNALASVLK